MTQVLMFSQNYLKKKSVQIIWKINTWKFWYKNYCSNQQHSKPYNETNRKMIHCKHNFVIIGFRFSWLNQRVIKKLVDPMNEETTFNQLFDLPIECRVKQICLIRQMDMNIVGVTLLVELMNFAIVSKSKWQIVLRPNLQTLQLTSTFIQWKI